MQSYQPMEVVKAGEILAAEGSDSKDVFILYDGELGIFKGDLVVSTINKKGSVVGEMGVILEHSRTATIKALSDSRVVRMEFNLEDLLKNQPALFLRIVKTLAERLKQTTQDYWYLTELSLTESDKYF